MTSLREFKIKQLLMLKEIEQELMQKYPEKADGVKYIVDIITTKLDNLRVYTLYDYLRTIDLASTEFREFRKLMPKLEEVEELLKDENG